MTWKPPRPEVRDPWYLAVIKHTALSNATKLLLVVMADDMKVYGEVSVPRSKLAAKLGVHPTRITERIKEAVDARLLDVVVKGRPGTTSVYQAMLPLGAPVRTKRARRRLNADGAPVRTTDMVRSLYQAEVHPSAPSAEREHGAPVQSPSSSPRPTVSDSPAVAGGKAATTGEAQSTSDLPSADLVGSCHGEPTATTYGGAQVNAYGVGHCVNDGCGAFEKLGPDDGLCSPCAVGRVARARAAS